MDREIFNKAVQGYVKDTKKNIPNLMEYAKVLHVQTILQAAIFETLQRRGTSYGRDSFKRVAALAENEDMQKRWKFFLKNIKENTLEFPFVIAEIRTFLIAMELLANIQVAPSPHLRPLVVMRQDVFIVIAFFGHAAGAVLAHADAVAGAVGGEGDLACRNFDGEVGGGEFQGFPDGAAFDEAVSDLHFVHAAAGAAADDFDIGAIDVAEGDLRAVSPYFFCKVFDGECMLFVLVSGVVFIRAVYADQVRHGGCKDILAVFGFAAAGGVEQGLLYQ